jgi:hypothetical protein
MGMVSLTDVFFQTSGGGKRKIIVVVYTTTRTDSIGNIRKWMGNGKVD